MCIILAIVYFIDRMNVKKYHETVDIAKENVDNDINEGTKKDNDRKKVVVHDEEARGLLSRNAEEEKDAVPTTTNHLPIGFKRRYKGKYTENGKTFETTTILKFTKIQENNKNDDDDENINNSGGWTVTGCGKDADGRFVIAEGKVATATGRAYWIERWVKGTSNKPSKNTNDGTRNVVNVGTFSTSSSTVTSSLPSSTTNDRSSDPPFFRSFTGSWRATNGVTGEYIDFEEIQRNFEDDGYDDDYDYDDEEETTKMKTNTTNTTTTTTDLETENTITESNEFFQGASTNEKKKKS